MGQFTYTQLVFGSIAFKCFNLGQTFQVAFHKLPTISWVSWLLLVVWLFNGCFGAVASSLLSGLSGYVDIGLVLLWIYSALIKYSDSGLDFDLAILTPGYVYF